MIKCSICSYQCDNWYTSKNGGLSQSHNNFFLRGRVPDGFTLTARRPSPRIAPSGARCTRKLKRKLLMPIRQFRWILERSPGLLLNAKTKQRYSYSCLKCDNLKILLQKIFVHSDLFVFPQNVTTFVPIFQILSSHWNFTVFLNWWYIEQDFIF